MGLKWGRPKPLYSREWGGVPYSKPEKPPPVGEHWWDRAPLPKDPSQRPGSVRTWAEMSEEEKAQIRATASPPSPSAPTSRRRRFRSRKF